MTLTSMKFIFDDNNICATVPTHSESQLLSFLYFNFFNTYIKKKLF